MCELCAQQSASGIGVLTDQDAVYVPSKAVDSAVVFTVTPAPYGLSELSTAMIVVGLPSAEVSAWISGYAFSEHARVSFGARRRWSLGTGFSIGLRAESTVMVFRGFSNAADLRVGVHATMRKEEWTFGAAIDDIAVVGVEPLPSLRCSAGYSMPEVEGSFDLIMNGAQELTSMLTGRWIPSQELTLVGSVLASPLTLRLDVRLSTIEPIDVVVGFNNVEDLGFSSHIALRWPW